MMRSGNRRKIFRNKAERPLLLLFPGCCNDVASEMRIRKGQARARGNVSARRESNSFAALAAATGSQDLHDKRDEFLLVEERSPSSAGEKCETIPERVVVRSEAPPSSLAALQTSANRSPTPPDRPYMNLDEFVNSLARKNCFPDEEFFNPYSDHRHKAGESSGSIKFPGPIDDQSTPHFSRVDSGSSMKNIGDEVDTSLRLAISPREIASATDPARRIKGGNIVMNTEEVVAGTPDDGRRQHCTTTVSEGRIGSALEAGQTILAQSEAYGQSCHTAPTTSILESTEVEVEAGQPDQTMKSSTEREKERAPFIASIYQRGAN